MDTLCDESSLGIVDCPSTSKVEDTAPLFVATALSFAAYLPVVSRSSSKLSSLSPRVATLSTVDGDGAAAARYCGIGALYNLGGGRYGPIFQTFSLGMSLPTSGDAVLRVSATPFQSSPVFWVMEARYWSEMVGEPALAEARLASTLARTSYRLSQDAPRAT